MYSELWDGSFKQQYLLLNQNEQDMDAKPDWSTWLAQLGPHDSKIGGQIQRPDIMERYVSSSFKDLTSRTGL
jgi:hypothetical protein